MSQFRMGAGGREASRARRECAAFSYVELLVGLVVVIIAAGGLFASMLESQSLSRTNDETALAYDAAERMLEELASADFGEVFKRYNDSAADDGGAAFPGSNFAVPGLQARAADADGFPGLVEFPAKPGGVASEIHEDTDDSSFGMPRDLNADGVVDGVDHANDYNLLPVRVHVEWTGANGDRSVSLETLLSPR